MAFPSNQGTIPLTLSQTFDQIRALAGSIKNAATSLNTRSLAGDISAYEIVSYCTILASQRDQVAALAATTGLAAYVTEYYPTVNIVSAYTDMIAQVDSTVLWITTNFPTSAGGDLLERKWGAGGKTINNTFSTSTLSTFRTQLTALIAQID